MNRRTSRILLVLGILVLTIALDQGTKVIARNTLADSGIHRVVGNIFVLLYTENSGGFLSLGAGWPVAVRQAIFIVLSVAILALLLVYILRAGQLTTSVTVALALVAGGGIGNIIDRIFRGGHVTDFLNVGIGSLRTGIFNLADFFVLVGAILLIFASFGGRKKT
ncbi:MAG TPA: signal peptidase II [Spirochaetia bacterium]|nr:signal peptidase II [Spirochaetia bacterium]